jgi:hypothetical protein
MSEHIVGVNPQEYNGRKYRSTLEAKTAETLDKMGLSWEYESKKLTLQEGFRCQYQKEKVRAIEYTPDFIIGPIMLETKGYETPDWKIKKKLLYKYLTENEPDAIFYMVKNNKQLLEALDHHWINLGFAIQVSPKPQKKKRSTVCGCTTTTPASLSPRLYDSITEALYDLGLKNKPVTPILKSLTGQKEFVYNYNWKLIKIKL